jgi:hypothetical protein
MKETKLTKCFNEIYDKIMGNNSKLEIEEGYIAVDSRYMSITVDGIPFKLKIEYDIDEIIDKTYDYILTTFCGWTKERQEEAFKEPYTYIADYVTYKYDFLCKEEQETVINEVEVLIKED